MPFYWYCGVRIPGVDAVYSYISDDGEWPVGSFVEVPFGSADRLLIGQIVTAGRYTRENAPYPVERTKHITRIATAEEYEAQGDNPLEAVSHRDRLLNYIDDRMEHADWGEVLDWTYDNIDSSDKVIADKAVECLKRCVELELPEAMVELGTAYYNGRAVPQDFAEAFRLYKMAADQGSVRALCNCGYCFYYGRHQAVDYAEAYRCFSLGALLYDDANCLYMLGDMYLAGQGVEQNTSYAYTLYARAAACHGNHNDGIAAAIALRRGKCLLHGQGTVRNVEKAFRELSFALPLFCRCHANGLLASHSLEETKQLLADAAALLEQGIY